MKQLIPILVSTGLAVGIPTIAMTAPADGSWQALVTQAYGESDAVIRGAVQSVDDQTEVDGGHVYEIQVAALHKGTSSESVSVRAGGFFYRVPLDVGETVLVFLRSSGSSAPASLVEASPLTPMVFRETTAASVSAFDSPLQSELSGVSIRDVEALLAELGE